MTGCAGAVPHMIIADPGPSGAGAAGQLILRLSALDLAALPGAVPSARKHTRAVLDAWGLTPMADEAELVVSELVTNAVTAVGKLAAAAMLSPIRLRLSDWASGRRTTGLQVEVRDASDRFPRRRREAPLDQPGGWGLVLVGVAAEHWGCYATSGGGKVVWAMLEFSPGRPAR